MKSKRRVRQICGIRIMPTNHGAAITELQRRVAPSRPQLSARPTTPHGTRRCRNGRCTSSVSGTTSSRAGPLAAAPLSGSMQTRSSCLASGTCAAAQGSPRGGQQRLWVVQSWHRHRPALTWVHCEMAWFPLPLPKKEKGGQAVRRSGGPSTVQGGGSVHRWVQWVPSPGRTSRRRW